MQREIGPIPFYAFFLAFVLSVLVLGHLYLVLFPSRFRTVGLEAIAQWMDSLALVLTNPLAIALGWTLSALSVCGLLYLWLKNPRVAAVLTGLLIILWLIGSFRYVQHVPENKLNEWVYRFISAANLSRIQEGPTDLPNRVAGILTFFLATGVLVIAALWFLQPMRGLLAQFLTVLWLLAWLVYVFGLQERQAGAVFLASLILTCGAFAVGLYLASGRILPLPGGEQRSKVFGFVRDCYISKLFRTAVNFPVYVVVDEPYEEDKVEERISGDRFAKMALGPGFAISDCDHAMAISAGIKFKGVQPPPVDFTGYADQVIQTIDLRPQHRAFHVEALTKDGIKIKVLLFLAVTIDAGERRPKLGEHLPYNKSAAFKAVHAQRMDYQGITAEQRPWHDLPRMLSERIMQRIISEYDFDDLYGPDIPEGPAPRQVISRKYQEALTAELKPLGIRWAGGGISDLEPADPQVYIRRVKNWQAEWERKITLSKAEGQTEWLRMVERARAEAQADLILSLGRQLAELSAARTEFAPEPALRLLTAVVEELMARQPTPTERSKQTDTLLEIRKALGA